MTSTSPNPTPPVAERIRALVLDARAHDVARARDGLADPDPAVRSAALGALAGAGQLGESVLRRAFADAAPAVRRRAAELSARVDGEGIAAHLTTLLHDDEPLVAEAAAWALGERGTGYGGVGAAELAGLMTTAGAHGAAIVREAAVAALGALGDPAALPVIIDAIADVVTVRRRAVIALAPYDGPAVHAALARARSDRDWQVRNAAEDLYALISAPEVERP